MKRLRGVWVCLAFAAGLSAAVAFARPGIVRTTDGQAFEGDVSTDESDANIVVVKVRGIPMRLARSSVASIEYTQGFEKEFADKMAKLAANDVAGRLALAREALDRREYNLARDAAEAARNIDPNSADAVAMLETIRSQMRLDQQPRPATQPDKSRESIENREAGATTEPAAGDLKLIRPADINAIKLQELRPEDRNVRIRFDRDVSRRFMRYANLPPAEWNAMTDNEKVQRILAEGTPEMRRDVLILNDPPVLFQYRRNVQPWVLQNCATSGCHGGAEGAKFSLILPGESDAATYTNFYLLQRYKKETRQSSDAIFGRGDLRMIDRQRPEQSLLLQNGLPGAIAEYDHPDVPNYRPALRNTADPRYRLVLDWIASLRPVDTDYGIAYDAQDAGGAATQPATTQATSAPAEPPGKPTPATRPTPRASPRAALRSPGRPLVSPPLAAGKFSR